VAGELHVVDADGPLQAEIRAALAWLAHGPLCVTASAERVAVARARHPGCVVIVVRARRSQVAGALDLGADAVLIGPLRAAELRARVSAIFRRREASLSMGSLTLEPGAWRATIAGRELRLPPRELALLLCLAAAPGRVFTKAELLAACWGAERPNSRTLERHAARLRRRLGAHGALLVTVWGVGFRLDEPA
jgi:DNA-binding response OmpR family regulator